MQSWSNMPQLAGPVAVPPVAPGFVRQRFPAGAVPIDYALRDFVPPRDRLSQEDIVRLAEVNQQIFQSLTRNGEPLPLDNGAGLSVEKTFAEAMSENVMPPGMQDGMFGELGGTRCEAEKRNAFTAPFVQDTGTLVHEAPPDMPLRPENIPGSERAFMTPHNDFVKSVALEKSTVGGDFQSTINETNANLHVPLGSQNKRPDTARVTGASDQGRLSNDAFTIMYKTTQPRGRLTSKRARPQSRAEMYSGGGDVDASHGMQVHGAAKRVYVRHLKEGSFTGGSGGATDDKVRSETDLPSMYRRISARANRLSAPMSSNSRSSFYGTDMEYVSDKTSVPGEHAQAAGTTDDKVRSKTELPSMYRRISARANRLSAPMSSNSRSSFYGTDMEYVADKTSVPGEHAQSAGTSDDKARQDFSVDFRSNATSQGGVASYEGRSQSADVNNIRTKDVVKTYLAMGGKLPNDPKVLRDLRTIINAGDVTRVSTFLQRIGLKAPYQGRIANNIDQATSGPSLTRTTDTTTPFARLRTGRSELFDRSSASTNANDGATLQNLDDANTLHRQRTVQNVSMTDSSLSRGVSLSDFQNATAGGSMVFEGGITQMRQRPEANMYGFNASYPNNPYTQVSANRIT
jgi:hypothetical protein